ncbi:TetR/AcrR family transcriptional regulator [Pseudalkalibacillus decolorationis]|uniref:TetR/AcrR family transcriptional regulator n=1 Tax=Pseudalkalibacillus decolorationis TaxID=163879 RepID=UPI002147C408|nr:TetR/AcrR family transcriptional regulator [Pseudalkalibacillus decolorationis]
MAPRNEEQNKQIKDERREQILQAALKVFSRRGLAATKISKIANEAGLSHGLVYHYFSSKDEIFTMLVERALDGSKMVVDDAIKQNLPPLDQLRWLTEAILKGISDDGAYFYIIMVQAFTSDAVPEQVKAMVKSKSPSILEGIIPIIISGQQAGQIIKDNPTKLAGSYFAFIQGIAIQQVQQTDKLVLPDTELILRMFKS